MEFNFIREGKYIRGARIDLSISDTLLIYTALRDLSKNEEYNELDRKSAIKMLEVFEEERERIVI